MARDPSQLTAGDEMITVPALHKKPEIQPLIHTLRLHQSKLYLTLHNSTRIILSTEQPWQRNPGVFKATPPSHNIYPGQASPLHSLVNLI